MAGDLAEAVDEAQVIDDLFSDLDGVPITPEDSHAASQFYTSIETQLQQITRLVQSTSGDELGIPAAFDAREDTSSAAQHFSGLKIEEITEDAHGASETNSVPENSLLVRLLLLAAQYSLPAAPPATNTNKAAPVPWASPATSAAASNLLHALSKAYNDTYPTDDDSMPNSRTALIVEATQTESTQHSTDLERLLTSSIPLLTKRLLPTLSAYSHHMSSEKTRVNTYTGPGTFDRAVAAAQLGWAVHTLTTGTALTPRVVDAALPCLLRCLDDPSPSVQLRGLWPLAHIVSIAPVEEVAAWRGVIEEAVVKAVSGCEERVWPAAAHALVSIAVKLQGTSPYTSSLHTSFATLLEEAERHAHQPAYCLIFCQTTPGLFPLLGLQLVEHSSRLLPLLLEWSMNYNKHLRTASLRALEQYIKYTWPRVPAHADVIWRELDRVWVDEKRLAGQEAEEVVHALIQCGVAVWLCGGEQFKAGVEEESHQEEGGRYRGINEEGEEGFSFVDAVKKAVAAVETGGLKR